MSKRGQGYSPGWRRATMIAFPPLIRAAMKRDWHGHEHIPREGGVIVAANHLSYADWAAVALFVYESGRYPAFLIKSPVFGVKFLGAFLRACGQLPVYRGQTDAALVLKDAQQAVENGEALIFYPEGTATRDPALWPMTAYTGVARLALATGAPVIPVAHWGAQDILPYGTKDLHLVPRRAVRMLAGPPVDLSAFEGREMNREMLRDATAVIMADITRLLAELRHETPPEKPYDPVAARRAARKTGAEAPTGKDAGEVAAGGPGASAGSGDGERKAAHS